MMKNNWHALRVLNKSKVEVPLNPTETYSNEYDIIHLDRHILIYLKRQQEDQIPPLRIEIHRLQKEMTKVSSRVSRLTIETRCQELQQRIYSLNTNIEAYQYKAKDFLLIHANSENPIERLINIEKYLQMIKPFYPHNIRAVPVNYAKDACVDCQVGLVEDGDLWLCPQCNRSYDTYENVTDSGINNDAKVNHFIKIIDQVEGKTSYILSQEYRLRLDEIIKHRRLNRVALTRADIVSAVYAIGDATHYQHISQIAHQYANIPLPNYDIYREDIIRNYCLFLQVYETLPKDLTSVLNGLYMLYRLLNLQGVDIELASLRPPITERTLEQYEDIFRRVNHVLGWNA